MYCNRCLESAISTDFECSYFQALIKNQGGERLNQYLARTDKTFFESMGLKVAESPFGLFIAVMVILA